MRACSLPVLALALLLVSFAADAQPYRIVALGASNTAGYRVPAAVAWPSRLQAILHAGSYPVQVRNAGRSGDDTGRMLARLDRAVPRGTHLVILDTTDRNDRRRGIDNEANVRAIVSRLDAKGIRTLVIPSLHALSERRLRRDGIHITAAGHATVAARLALQVKQMIGRRPAD